jgi:hypothetical protein
MKNFTRCPAMLSRSLSIHAFLILPVLLAEIAPLSNPIRSFDSRAINYTFEGWPSSFGMMSGKAPSSEEARVYRPRPWAEHRHTGTKDPKQDVNPCAAAL